MSACPVAIIATGRFGCAGVTGRCRHRNCTARGSPRRRCTVGVLPDGTGLPPGRATVEQGKELFAKLGAPFHGADGEGTDAAPRLVGGIGSLASPDPIRTVGSYWPYAPIIFDYIWRAMPASAPQSLTPDECYALTAWVLWANGIIPGDTVIDQDTLSQVIMPNREGFTSPDPRPDVGSEAS